MSKSGYIAAILLIQSFCLRAQVQFVRLFNFDLLNQVSSYLEKLNYPIGGELVIEEKVSRKFDEFGRLVSKEAKEP